jgi:hypothetical protein
MLSLTVLDNTCLNTLSEQEKQSILATAEVITIETGTILYKEGDAADCFHCLLEGSVNITSTENATKTEFFITEVKAGELIGESSLLENNKRSANVTANTTCRLLKIPMQQEERQNHTNTQLQVVTKILFDRQRQTNNFLGEKIVQIKELSNMLLGTIMLLCIYSFTLSMISDNYINIKYAALQGTVFSILTPIFNIIRIKYSRLQFEDYGLTFARIKPALIEAAACAIIMISVFYLLTQSGLFPDYTLHEPLSKNSFLRINFIDNIWGSSAVLFIFGFGQAVVLGSYMVSSLRKMLPYRYAGLISVLISCLIMYTTLSHYGWYTPVYFFINSCIWMLLFLRHKSVYPVALFSAITYIVCINVISF